MPDIGKALRDEIVRIAKREAGILLSAQAKTIKLLKREVAALKKKQVQLAKTPVAQPVKTPAAQTKTPEKKPVASAAKAPAQNGFTPGDIRKTRARLGLSQAEFAKLCGVSANSVGNWETSKKRKLDLRPGNLESLATVRAMSQDEAKKALAETKA